MKFNRLIKLKIYYCDWSHLLKRTCFIFTYYIYFEQSQFVKFRSNYYLFVYLKFSPITNIIYHKQFILLHSLFNFVFLQEYNAKLLKVKDVQKEIRSHLHNLPDLTQLPDVTGGLAPLPSAGDLFNIH